MNCPSCVYGFPPLALGRVLDSRNEQAEKGEKQASRHEEERIPLKEGGLEQGETKRGSEASKRSG